MNRSPLDNAAREPREARGTPSWITEGGLVRATWRLALPMTVGVLFQDLLSIVDMVFVGSLGANAIAGVAVGGVLLGIVNMLAIGITTGCMALVAQAVGARDRAAAEQVAGQSLLMGAALSVVVAAAGVPLAGHLLRGLGASPDVVAEGKPYLQIMAGGSFAMILSFTFASAVRGAGDAVTPLKIMAVANVVNIELDPILIYGMYGMPRLEVAGSAVASVIATVVALCMLAWVFFAGRHEHFHLRPAHLRVRWRSLWRIFKIGVFGSGQMLIRNVSAIALVRIVALFGPVALAGYGIGMRLWFAVLMPGLGFGTAAATLVGQNIGARKPARAARAAWVAVAMWAAVAGLVGLGYFAFAERLIALFNQQPGVVETGAGFLRWVAFTFAFTALSAVLGRAMSGAGDTFWPMVITGVAMLAVRIPLCYGLARAWHSAAGVWAGMAASNVVQALLFVAAFVWGHWKMVGSRLVESAAPSAVALTE